MRSGGRGECLTFLHFFLINLLPPFPSFQSLHMPLWVGMQRGGRFGRVQHLTTVTHSWFCCGDKGWFEWRGDRILCTSHEMELEESASCNPSFLFKLSTHSCELGLGWRGAEGFISSLHALIIKRGQGGNIDYETELSAFIHSDQLSIRSTDCWIFSKKIWAKSEVTYEREMWLLGLIPCCMCGVGVFPLWSPSLLAHIVIMSKNIYQTQVCAAIYSERNFDPVINLAIATTMYNILYFVGNHWWHNQNE